jgi:hypothetical protein
MLVEVLITGQTVIPPSIHPKTEKPYVWLTDCTLLEVHVNELPELPPDIIERLEVALRPWLPVKTYTRPPNGNGARPTSNDRMRRYAEAALDGEMQTLRATQEGGRNRQLFDAGCRLGKYVHHHVLSEEEVASALLDAAKINGLIGDDGLKQCEASLRSGLRMAKRDELPILEDRGFDNGHGQQRQASGAVHDSERKPPYNIQLEQALLTAILRSADTLEIVSEIIDSSALYDRLHGEIFEVAFKMAAGGRRPDALTVAAHFNGRKIDDEHTVAEYIDKITETATIINARSHAETIKDLATLRRLIKIGEDIVNGAFSGETSPKEQIENAEQALYKIAEKSNGGDEKSFAQILGETLARAAAAQAAHKEGRMLGLGTGLHDLDRPLGGLQASDLIILAGRPGKQPRRRHRVPRR